MGLFSPGVPVIPTEKHVIPALRRGYLAAFSASVCTQFRRCRDKRGNDGILTKQLADVNTP